MQPSQKGGSEGESGGASNVICDTVCLWLHAQPSAIEGPRASVPPAAANLPSRRECRAAYTNHRSEKDRTVHVAFVVLHPIQASFAQNNGVCGSAQTGGPRLLYKDVCAVSPQKRSN